MGWVDIIGLLRSLAYLQNNDFEIFIRVMASLLPPTGLVPVEADGYLGKAALLSNFVHPRRKAGELDRFTAFCILPPER